VRLSDFKVLSFDCYGTLIDWESGMLQALAPIAAKAPRKLGRDEILESHARCEAAQQQQTPGLKYSLLLAIVAKRLAEEWQAQVSWSDCTAYGQSVKDWPAFPDSAASLAYLRQHYRLVVLSNIDNDSFAASNARLGVNFDAVYTAEDIGSYKPSAANFTYMLSHLNVLGLGPNDILHTAQSLFHDHVPATQAGLARCWIDRRHATGGFGATARPDEMPKVDFHFHSLAAMVEAHRQER
jgi:2-haloacid dehalogenase